MTRLFQYECAANPRLSDDKELCRKRSKAKEMNSRPYDLLALPRRQAAIAANPPLR